MPPLSLHCTASQADKTKALFQVAVAFETRGMGFTPNETAILDEINANTLEGISAVAQVRLLQCSLLNQQQSVCSPYRPVGVPWGKEMCPC
jgi:hypothetical protein